MMKNICLNGLNNATPSGLGNSMGIFCYNIIIPSGLDNETKKPEGLI
ncbi:MAG: hypothetical protein IT238_00090 [Bacteroidia bacterium]|nr:hypothetical protein [Bacteroidia bacterium]MCZ2249639.1 hypothetical protein [Bacteroidia bacterium]